MRKYFYIKRLNITLFIGAIVILAGCGDPILDIEESNAYHWQKNMNQAEFEKLKEGMTYSKNCRGSRGISKRWSIPLE